MSNPTRNENVPEPIHVAPLLSKEEIVRRKRWADEAAIVKIMCSTFSVSQSSVYKVSKEYGFDSLTLKAFNKVVTNPFPLRISIALPQSGKGLEVTLNRLLRNPLGVPFIRSFVELPECVPVTTLMISHHPRVEGFVGITGYPIVSGRGHISFNVPESSGPMSGTRLTIGSLSSILVAYQTDSEWYPLN